jgi:uncharacterized protein (TIGR02996 family)
MPVYFVYRSIYGTPSEKHLRRFEYDTVLAWVQGVWKMHDEYEDARRYAERVFGGPDSDLFGYLFHNDGEDTPPQCPRTMAEAKRWFNGMLSEEDAHGPHHLQVLTEWDENQRAAYVFDDHYRAKKPGKTDFLLLDGWELPAGESAAPLPRLPRTERKGRVPGEGTLYLVCLFSDCKYNLDDLDPPSSLGGLRVPDLARYILLQPGPDDLVFPLNKVRDGLLEVLKKPKGEEAGFLVAIRDHPDDLTSWSAYSDWLEDRDLPPAGLHLLERALRQEKCGFVGANRKPKLDLVKVTPHLAQASKHESCGTKSPKDKLTVTDTFVQFVFFDDRWAAAHPTLATGILTFAARWDVLT